MDTLQWASVKEEGTTKSTKSTKGIIIEPLMDTNGHESREEGEERRK